VLCGAALIGSLFVEHCLATEIGRRQPSASVPILVYRPRISPRPVDELLSATLSGTTSPFCPHGAGGTIASQIPILYERRDGKLYLQGHLARGNRNATILDGQGEALAVFTGPHAYISPGLVPAGPAVPTWNYASVHVYGSVRAIDDPEWLRRFCGDCRSATRLARRRRGGWTICRRAFWIRMLKGSSG